MVIEIYGSRGKREGGGEDGELVYSTLVFIYIHRVLIYKIELISAYDGLMR